MSDPLHPETPDYNRRRTNEQLDRKDPGEKPKRDTTFTLSMGSESEDDEASAPTSAKFRQLRAEEAKVRALPADKRIEGWTKLLRDEFSAVAGALESLPADAQSNRFHAVWDTPVIADLPTARLKLWYGRDGDDLQLTKGKGLLALQMSNKHGVVIDCTDLASAAYSQRPFPNFSDTFTDLAMHASDHLKSWANRATDRTRSAEIRRVFAPV